jgi:hypothetical protein
MSSVLSKILESENLDAIFQPFSQKEIEDKEKNWLSKHIKSIWVEEKPRINKKIGGYQTFYFEIPTTGPYRFVARDTNEPGFYWTTGVGEGVLTTWNQVPKTMKTLLMNFLRVMV